MIIQIDTRENLPYNFTRYPCETEVAALKTGDYSVRREPGGETCPVAVERKSIDDLIGTLTVGRQRFERELERARSLDYFCVVIEASMDDIRFHRYKSKAQPHAMSMSILSLGVEFGVPFIFAGSRAGGEYATYGVLYHWLRKNVPPVNK
jgi:ERCC4-type nuclease